MSWTRMIGRRFGRLKVVGFAGTEEVGGTSARLWLCKCSCGNTHTVRTALLNSGQVKSCGCLRAEWIRPSLAGLVFGKLTVLEAIGVRNRCGMWLCRCECGAQTKVQTGALKGGHIRSCRDCGKRATCILPPGEAMCNRVIEAYQFNAQLRAIPFTLSRRRLLLLFRSNCHYCGCPPSNTRSKPTANGSFTYNGLDRKNNQRGYTAANIVPCCRVCNVRKGAAGYSDFVEWIRRCAATLAVAA